MKTISASLRSSRLKVATVALLRRYQERAQLAWSHTEPCDLTQLRGEGSVSLPDAWAAVDEAEWSEVRRAVSSFGIPDGTGGVNPGDRRAVYSLVRYLKPRRMLEVGTHIGASTVHLALALERNGFSGAPELTTVDVRDVNDQKARPWRNYGTAFSPAEMIQQLGLADHVSFKTSPSLTYLYQAQGPFDLIFLDGDHAAGTVYREVPAALKLLGPGGCILLHDYFPGGQPLWSNGTVVHGPFTAMRRLRKECPALSVVPFGQLPWDTKLGSNRTSLALVLQSESLAESAFA